MKIIKKLIIATALASILAPALPTCVAAESTEEDIKEAMALTPAEKREFLSARETGKLDAQVIQAA